MFAEQFGAEQLWRWEANEAVDALVQQEANQLRNYSWETSMMEKDAVTCRVNAFFWLEGRQPYSNMAKEMARRLALKKIRASLLPNLMPLGVYIV